LHESIAFEEAALATVVITAGVCGFTTRVQTSKDGEKIDGPVNVAVDSDCPHVAKLAEELTTVAPFREISFRGEGPLTLALGAKYCAHPACPVPAGIVKAIEVEAGLALPADVHMTIARD
jgi:hypothetical protein